MVTIAPKFGITDQMWSYIVLITGCVMIVLCRHMGITEDVGAGIVGAGIQAFTAQQKIAYPANPGQGPTT
jgi:hypothetical protein